MESLHKRARVESLHAIRERASSHGGPEISEIHGPRSALFERRSGGPRAEWLDHAKIDRAHCNYGPAKIRPRGIARERTGRPPIWKRRFAKPSKEKRDDLNAAADRHQRTFAIVTVHPRGIRELHGTRMRTSGNTP